MSEDVMARQDVVVVGGGVIGLACALALREAGRDVLVLERGECGAATSFGNCGTLTPSHALPLASPGMVGKALQWMLRPDAPFYIKPRFDPVLWRWLLAFARRCDPETYRRAAVPKAALLQASQGLLADWLARHGLDCQHQQTGLSYLYRDPAAFEAARQDLDLLDALEIETRVVDGAVMAKAEPALRPGVVGALHFPGDAHLRPDRYTSELARVFRALGGDIREHCTVLGMESADEGMNLRLAHGRLQAREVVLAVGPWSPAMARSLGLRLPIQPGKGYSITYSRPSVVPSHPVVLKERAVCVTAWADGFRLGSTMEFAGYDDSLNPLRLDALERGAAEYLREPVGQVRQASWFGWRPMTWDDLPILGASPRHPHLWLAVGHGMMGMSMSAVTGRLIADMVTGRESLLDMAPYSPRRFG